MANKNEVVTKVEKPLSWIWDKERLTEMARSIDKSIILTTKDSWFWRMVAWMVTIVTFGAVKRKPFLERFATTIGSLQAYPRSWKVQTVEKLLVHESRHVKQFRWLGLWIHPWVGLIPYGICYLILPFPVLFAWLRYRFELDADSEYWRHLLKQGFSDETVRNRAMEFCETVTGPKYFWSWPNGLAKRGFEKKVEKVIKEHGKS